MLFCAESKQMKQVKTRKPHTRALVLSDSKIKKMPRLCLSFHNRLKPKWMWSTKTNLKKTKAKKTILLNKSWELVV